jgi:hypothetical protein
LVAASKLQLIAVSISFLHVAAVNAGEPPKSWVVIVIAH